MDNQGLTVDEWVEILQQFKCETAEQASEGYEIMNAICDHVSESWGLKQNEKN